MNELYEYLVFFFLINTHTKCLNLIRSTNFSQIMKLKQHKPFYLLRSYVWEKHCDISEYEQFTQWKKVDLTLTAIYN